MPTYYATSPFMGDGATTVFNFSWSYINASHVKAYVDGVETAFSFLTASSVSITPAPANGTLVVVQRETPINASLVNFQDGNVLLEANLDLQALQLLYVSQETLDRASATAAAESATDAAASEAAAAASAAAAAASETAADTSESNASASATAAAGSATAAAGSETGAAGSATSAASSAAAAAGSATQAAGVIAALSAATSTTSLSVGTGSKVFTVSPSDTAFVLGQRWRAASDSGDTIMEGAVTAFTSTTVTLDVDYTKGAGTHADWNLSIAGEPGDETQDSSKYRWLFIIEGDSNGAGYAQTADADAGEITTKAGVQIMDAAGTAWADLKIGSPSMNNQVDSNIANDGTRHGLELQLAAQQLAGDWGSYPVYLVKSAVGGARIANKSGGLMFAKFLTRATAAINLLRDAGYVPRPVIIYVGGYNDYSIGMTAANWKTYTTRVLKRYREWIGFVPIIFPEVGPGFTTYNTSASELGRAIPWLFAIKGSDLTQEVDNIHYTYASYKTLMDRIRDVVLDTRFIGGGFDYDRNRERAEYYGAYLAGAVLPTADAGFPYSGMAPSAVTWENLTQATDAGSGTLNCTGSSGTAGARSVQTIDLEKPFEIQIDIASGTVSETVVVALTDEVIDGDYAWNTAGQSYLFGAFVSSSALFVGYDDTGNTNLGALGDKPAIIRLRNTADGDMTVEVSNDAGENWTLKHTASGILKYRRQAVLKAIFAVAGTSLTVTVRLGTG